MENTKAISQNLIDLLNKRIKEEELSSRLYKSMAVWLSYTGFSGAAKLWAKYSAEEQAHAEWAYSFLGDLDVLPCIQTLEEQPKEFGGLVDIIQKSYDHELYITKSIDELGKAAMEEGCFMLFSLVMKYQAEQIEELGKTTYWLDRLEAFGDSEATLRLLDNEMGED